MTPILPLTKTNVGVADLPAGCSLKKDKAIGRSKQKTYMVEVWTLRLSQGQHFQIFRGRNLKWLLFQLKIYLLIQEYTLKGVFDKDRWYYKNKIANK